MADRERYSYIPTRLKNAAEDGHVAWSEDIFDDAIGKSQKAINEDVFAPSSGIDDRLKTIEEGVTYSGTIQTEGNPANVISGSTKVTTANSVRGAIDIKTGYFECTTGGSTAKKSVNATGYVLSNGGAMKIWMQHANTANNVTLSINSTDEKPLYYNGVRAGSDNSWDAGEVLSVYYNASGTGAYYATNAQGFNKLNVDTSEADLDINDESNNTLVRFSEGHVKTKYFDSRDLKTLVGDEENADLDINDEEDNILARFSDGHVRTKNFDSRELKTFVDNEDNTDLDFSDENDNVVMRIADGHVRTKNFDSRNINIDSNILNFVKNKYKGLRCVIVGDSISSYEGTSPSGYQERYPDGDVTDVSQMWWKIVCDTLEMTPVNCSWRGSRVSGAPKGNAYAACSDARVTDIGRNGDPDIVIFFIGCNDWGSNTEPTAVYGTWSVDDPIVDDSNYTSTQRVDDIGAAYALMLSKTQKAYPHAKLFCCTITDEYLRDFDGDEKQEPPQYPPINARGVSNFTWNRKLKDVMEALGATCINVHDCGMNFFNLVNYVTDDTGEQGTALHPNKAGMKLIANKVISALLAG